MGLTPTQRGWPISKQTAATLQASLLHSGLKKTFKNVKLKKIPMLLHVWTFHQKRVFNWTHKHPPNWFKSIIIINFFASFHSFLAHSVKCVLLAQIMEVVLLMGAFHHYLWVFSAKVKHKFWNLIYNNS